MTWTSTWCPWTCSTLRYVTEPDHSCNKGYKSLLTIQGLSLEYSDLSIQLATSPRYSPFSMLTIVVDIVSKVREAILERDFAALFAQQRLVLRLRQWNDELFKEIYV